MICNVSDGYCFNSQAYSRKNSVVRLWGFSVTESTVINLVKEYLNSGKTIFTDNFFISVKLAKYLLGRKTLTIGVLNKHRIRSKTLKTPQKYNFINYADEQARIILTILMIKKVHILNTKETVMKIEKLKNYKK